MTLKFVNKSVRANFLIRTQDNLEKYVFLIISPVQLTCN